MFLIKLWILCRFHCLPLEPQDIRKALEENNYGEIDLCVRDKPDEKLPFDCTQLYFLTCTKFWFYTLKHVSQNICMLTENIEEGFPAKVDVLRNLRCLIK